MVMRRLIPTLLLALLGTTVPIGCFFESRPHRTVVHERRSCPPAYHWEGNACVHNGKAKGHYKHKQKHKQKHKHHD
jgi:hypothetical protein